MPNKIRNSKIKIQNRAENNRLRVYAMQAGETTGEVGLKFKIEGSNADDYIDITF